MGTLVAVALIIQNHMADYTFLNTDLDRVQRENQLKIIRYFAQIIWLSMFAAFSIRLIREKYKKSLKFELLANLAVVIFNTIVTVLLYETSNTSNDSTIIKILVVNASFALLYLSKPFIYKVSNILYWQYAYVLFRAISVGLALATIVFVGLSLAVVAVTTFFSSPTTGMIYADIFSVSYFLIFPLFFTTFIPEKIEVTEEMPKFARMLGFYVLGPLSMLYTLIVVVYIIRALTTQELISNFTVPLTLFFVVLSLVTLFLIYPLIERGDKSAKSFQRFLAISSIPIIALYFYGITVRVNAYGFTIDRVMVIIVGFILVFAAVQFIFIKRARLSTILPASAILLLLITFMPLVNAFTISHGSQQQRFLQLLEQYGILKDNKLVALENDLNFEQSEDVRSTFYYLYDNHDVNFLIPYIDDSGVKAALQQQGSRYQSSYTAWDAIARTYKISHAYEYGYYFENRIEAYTDRNLPVSVTGYDNLIAIFISRSNASYAPVYRQYKFSITELNKGQVIISHEGVESAVDLNPIINILQDKSTSYVYLSQQEMTIETQMNGYKYKFIVEDIEVEKVGDGLHIQSLTAKVLVGKI